MTPGEFGQTSLFIFTLVIASLMTLQMLAAFRYLALGQKLFLSGCALFQGYILQQVHRDGIVGLSVLILVLGDLAYLGYLLEPKSLTKKRRGKTILVRKQDLE